ncbi:MAG: hypothetical protein A2293_13475 [Elusimicrobia bacterium RIFOXYB2_FULL_49_7]|nr:MAG: hypothetical protein A2293_13475 [Elusimicrobia bacterium RIFOXYB2_FULL_49_7]
MSEFKKTVFKAEHIFDSKNKRHYNNGVLSVLHCHHYTSLYSQLAIDAKETMLLTDVAEDAFYVPLVDYFTANHIDSLAEKIELACQYYAFLGMGKMTVTSLGEDSGVVELANSHLDEGWKKKWGTYDKPVNYITAGFIAALFAAVLNKSVRSFTVSEVASIVMGAKQSLFNVVKK